MDREASTLDDLVNEGRYAEATSHAKSVLDRIRLWRQGDVALVLLAYLGKIDVETGRLREASEVVDSGETLASRDRKSPAAVRGSALL